jgi:ABC-2 type transport system ATP-binding protein
MAETGDVVVTRRLTKVFRDFWLRQKVVAVADLDLDIQAGEVFGLLGPNGSGKSTTLKMILGLLFPTRGTIAVFGRLPTDVAIKSRIGFLPEESYLYPFLDARETLDFYGRLFHQPRRQRTRRIDMLLEMVGLGSVAYRRVGEYSKGMQRRIGLAQALINDPDLLILDEPTAGMDPLGARQFKDLIETLSLRGKTVILSTHLLADVEDVCDRVCILYGGRQRAEGAITDLLARRDLTQITTQRLDAPTLEMLRRQLAAAGKDIVDVTAPRDKLESLFLRIVQEAQDQRLATGGALAGGPVAEFLRGQAAPAGREVIEQLVAAAETKEPTSPPPTPPASPSAPPPSQQVVLDELLGKSDKSEESTKGKKPPPPEQER